MLSALLRLLVVSCARCQLPGMLELCMCCINLTHDMNEPEDHVCLPLVTSNKVGLIAGMAVRLINFKTSCGWSSSA